jgi:hypothetical protein
MSAVAELVKIYFPLSLNDQARVSKAFLFAAIETDQMELISKDQSKPTCRDGLKMNVN